MSTRNAFILDTGVNFPIPGLANPGLLGVYGFYMPIIIFLDTLFEKKKPSHYYVSEYDNPYIDFDNYDVAYSGPAYTGYILDGDQYANRGDKGEASSYSNRGDKGEASSYSSYQALPELHRRRRHAGQQEDDRQKTRTKPHLSAKGNKLELGKTGSITDDQASVYSEITRAMAMTGMDGTSCLQYVVCEMAQRQFGGDSDAVDTPFWGNSTASAFGGAQGEHEGAQEGYEGADEGSADKAELRKGGKKAPAGQDGKKKRQRRSLVTDLLTTLLVPKPNQPLARFVEAAAPSSASCLARFPGCPAPFASLVKRIAEL